MSKRDKGHRCGKQPECVCGQLAELSALYEELRCLRKKAEANREKKKGPDVSLEFRMSEAESELLESTVCAASLASLRQQRDQVRGLVAALRQLSERVAKQEEESCQLEKEMADLQARICAVGRRVEEKRHGDADAMRRKRDQRESDESSWETIVAEEAAEQAHFLAEIKELNSCLEMKRAKDQSEDERRQERRKSDAQLLSNAIECVERHVHDSKNMMQAKKCL